MRKHIAEFAEEKDIAEEERADSSPRHRKLLPGLGMTEAEGFFGPTQSVGPQNDSALKGSAGSEEEEVVGGGDGEGGVAEEGVEERVAVAGEEWEETQRALLKAVVGIEGVGELLLVAGEDALARALSAAGFFAEAEELVEDFAFGGGERAEKSFVEFAEGAAEAGKKATD